ncbi:MAG: hypothetical protein LBP29_05685 [Treponema sp.]|jgi:hypothetical protein|nr:hypothetical protein [Treponema sp.]
MKDKCARFQNLAGVLTLSRFLRYSYFMVIEQTVEIPASRRLTIEVPPEVPAGRTILTFTPAPEISSAARGQSKNENFRSALRRAYGAWKEKPWENGLADVRTSREEWDHRDPWNPDSARRHRD